MANALPKSALLSNKEEQQNTINTRTFNNDYSSTNFSALKQSSILIVQCYSLSPIPCIS